MIPKITFEERNWLKEYSRRVRSRMEDLGINQSRLAELTGLDNGTIHNMYYGKRIPLVTNAIKVARALAMDTADLIDIA